MFFQTHLFSSMDNKNWIFGEHLGYSFKYIETEGYRMGHIPRWPNPILTKDNKLRVFLIHMIGLCEGQTEM